MRHRPAFRSSFVPAILVFMLLVLSVIIVRLESNENQDPRTRAADPTKTIYWGSVVDSDSPSTYFRESSSNCNGVAAQWLNVNDFAVDQCDTVAPHHPIFNTGEISQRNSWTLFNLPSGYACDTWIVYRYQINAAESVPFANGTGCTATGNFAPLLSTSGFGNNYQIIFKVKRQAPPGVGPAAPTLLSNSGNANSMTLTWTDNSNNETDFALYKNGQFTGETAPANSTKFTSFSFNCTIHRNQTFAIAARNAQGATVSNTLPLSCEPPAAPTLRTNTGNANSMTLTWTDNSNNEADFALYKNGQFTGETAPANSTSFTSYSFNCTIHNGQTFSIAARNVQGAAISNTLPLTCSSTTAINCNDYTRNWVINSITPTYTAGKVAFSIKGTFPQIATCGRRSMDGNGFSLVYTYNGSQEQSYYAYRPEHVVSVSETEVKLQPAYTYMNGSHTMWLMYCIGSIPTATPGACTSAKGGWGQAIKTFSITNPVGGGATVTPLPQCLAVIIRIRNTTTGECKLHNNSCVPEGWVKDDNCVLGTPTPSPRPALPAVTNLKYSCNAKGDKVTFTWDSVSGAANYQVRLDYHPDSWAPPYPTPTPNTNRDVNDQMPGLMSSRSWTPTILPNEEYWMTVQAVRSTDTYPYPGLYASTGRFTCRPTPTTTPTKTPTRTPTPSRTPTPTPPRATNSPTPPRATVTPPRATNTPRPNATITPPPGANTPVPNTPVPGNTNFNLALYLHGIGRGGTNVQPNSTGTMDPLTKTRSVTIDIFDANNQLLANRKGTVTYDNVAGNFKGSVDMGSLQPGSYTVKVRTPYYLRRAYPGIVQVGSNGTASLRPLAFVGADTDNSNSINVLDYNRILDCFQGFEDPDPAVCDSTKKADTDVTDDGITNEKDLNLFLVELAVQRGDDDIPLPSGVPTQ